MLCYLDLLWTRGLCNLRQNTREYATTCFAFIYINEVALTYNTLTILPLRNRKNFVTVFSHEDSSIFDLAFLSKLHGLSTGPVDQCSLPLVGEAAFWSSLASAIKHALSFL